MIAVAPRRGIVPNAVLAMLIFLFTEVMIFCALLSSYLVTRSQASSWPPLGQPRLPVEATLLNTLFLLASGWTMWQAVANPERTRRLLGWTLGLGAAFLVLQGVEWIALIRFGLTASSSVYGGFFYTIVGCHGLHLAVALLVVAIARWRPPSEDGLRAIRLYWGFVVGIWPPLYGLVYLW